VPRNVPELVSIGMGRLIAIHEPMSVWPSGKHHDVHQTLLLGYPTCLQFHFIICKMADLRIQLDEGWIWPRENDHYVRVKCVF
jgi:hypothetical protein